MAFLDRLTGDWGKLINNRGDRTDREYGKLAIKIVTRSAKIPLDRLW